MVWPTKCSCLAMAAAKTILPSHVTWERQLHSWTQQEREKVSHPCKSYFCIIYPNFEGTSLGNTHISGCPHKASQISHADGNPEKGLQFLCIELFFPGQYPGTILFFQDRFCSDKHLPSNATETVAKRKSCSMSLLFYLFFDTDMFTKVWC